MKKSHKILYSKCPSCKKHGLKAFNKMAGMHNPILTCKYCGKKFSMNMALAIIVKIGIPVFVGIIALIFNNIIRIPFWIYCVIGIILLLLFEYFAPLEEQDE